MRIKGKRRTLMHDVPMLASVSTGDLTKPPIPILVNGREVCTAADWASATQLARQLAARRDQAEKAIQHADPAGYLRMLETCETPPLASIRSDVNDHGDAWVVLVNGNIVGEYTESADAQREIARLNVRRRAIDSRLRQFDPAAYWRRVAQINEEAAEDNRQAGQRVELRAAMAAISDAERLHQRKEAGAHPKPPRRSPLRRGIVEAMRPLRAESLDLTHTLISLRASPPSGWEVTKEGACWRFENEDEDWPSELLTREQLRELFKDAKKTGRYRR